MKNFFFLFFFFFVIRTAFAQPDSTGKIKPKIIFGFDGRYSFIRQEPVDISGLKLGVELKQKWRVGVGFYGLLKHQDYTGTISTIVLNKEVNIPYTAELNFWYGAVYGEYVIAHKKRWEISTPLQFGIGQTHIYAFRNDNGKEIKGKNGKTTQTVYLIEPSVAGYYKVFRWIGVGTGIGYRKMINAEDRMNKNFDNLIYIIKAKLFLGDFVQVIKGKQRLLD